MSAPRPVDVARLGLGMAAVARPDLLLRLSKARAGRGGRVTVRILGARYVIQSSVGLILGQPQDRRWGRSWAHAWVRDADAAVDLIHASTMLALAAVPSRHRRLAVLSAGTAIAFAAADLQEKLGAHHVSRVDTGASVRAGRQAHLHSSALI